VNIEYLADRPEFVPTVARWYHSEWGHLRPGSTLENRAARVVQSCGHREIPTTFVAVAGDQALGSAMLVENDMTTRPELSPWLAGVFVPPELRGRGLGAALVERVVDEARALRIPRLFLYTDGPGTLYRRLGWSVMERTLYPPFWGDQEVTIMQLATNAP
jgi:predicted N-acetyltransferase YhbS